MRRIAAFVIAPAVLGSGLVLRTEGLPAAPVTFLTARPVEDATAVLHNPDMGWVLYENYPLDPDPEGSSTLLTLPEETFPEADAVALMASWQDVETAEGVYDFARLDHAYDRWKARGKAIQLRISTESLLWWGRADPPRGKGIPDYVLDRLPADRKQTREEGGLPYVVVDAREPYYRERLGRFLEVVARHFSGDRAVTLVDLRGFGLWGEWHSGYRYPSPEARRDALRRVLDAWAGAFPDRRLALSYSYDPDGPAEYRFGPTDRDDPAFTGHYEGFLRFSAFDHALDLPNVTWRRDGAGDAVHPNERRLNAEAFIDRGRGPMMSEFLGGYAAARRAGRAHVDRMVGDALSLHPNYVALLGWQGRDALDFTRERPDLIAQGLRTMGYRLVPTRISYPATVRPGESFRVEMEWANRGVGRALRDYRLRLTLADEEGRTLAACDAGLLETSRWVRDEIYRVAKEAKFRDVPAGRHQLRFALIDPESGRPIALPLVGGLGDRQYPIGGVRCEARP